MNGDQAVSTVIGAVLVLAIGVGAMTVYRLTVVPELKEDVEENHMDEVARGMAQLDSDLLDHLRKTSAAPMSSPVTVTPDSPPFVPSTAMSGALSFEKRTGSTKIASPSLQIVTRNGSSVLAGGSGSGGQWQTVQSGETIDNIEGLIGLRIKITDATPGDDDRLKITATDASGNYAGDLQVITDINNPDLDLIVQTQEPPSPGTVIFHNHIISIHQQRWDSQYWIDAMLDLYWFDLQVEQASKPATLTFTDLGLSAEYKVSYNKRVASGLSTIVGAGETITNYERSFNTGQVEFEAQNEFYPDQTLLIENGALVREQSEGSAFVIDPPLTAKAGGGFVKLGLDIPSLTGEDDTAGGSSIATVRSKATKSETFSATAGELDLTWGTDNPSLWADFLRTEMTEAGLTSQNCPPTSASSACQFEVTTTTSSVTLDLHGPTATDADPNNPTRDIAIETARAAIETEVQT